jgi:hypothetical protein
MDVLANRRWPGVSLLGLALVVALVHSMAAFGQVLSHFDTPDPATAAPPVRRPVDLMQFQYIPKDQTGKFRLQDQIAFGQKQILLDSYVAAKTIVFPSNSQIVLARSPKGTDAGFTFVAQVLDAGNNSRLEWLSPLSPSTTPPPRKRALDGYAGRIDGEAGGRGTDGEPGNPGYRGASAPTLTIIVGKITGGILTIDLRGQDGGPGGDGQDGGNGGAGNKGRRGVDNALGCSRGGDRGGDGGKGGAGGPAGIGGDGGDGGSIVILAQDPNALDHIRVFNAAGKPGKPGNPGNPGQGGPPGDGADGSVFCSGGGPGNRGSVGDGAPGLGTLAGRSGIAGTYVAAPLDVDTSNALQLPPM